MSTAIAPPAAQSAFRSYLDEVTELPTDALIGQIVMFTIFDTPIDRDWLAERFAALGMDEKLLPPEINPVDAFKKATSEAKDSYVMDDGNTATVLCRDVSSTNEHLTRQITREVRDARKRRLTYSKAITCVYHRGKRRPGQVRIEKGSERLRVVIDHTGLEPSEKADIERIAKDIQDRYHRYYKFLDGNKIRAVVRDCLHDLNSLELRAGVYFVQATRAEGLAKLQALITEIGNGCRMVTFPLVDLPSERQKIVDAFQQEAQGQLDEIVRDIADLKKSRKTITPAAYTKLKERYDQVMGHAQEYLDTLELSQDVTAASAELALAAIFDLQKTMMEGEDE